MILLGHTALCYPAKGVCKYAYRIIQNALAKNDMVQQGRHAELRKHAEGRHRVCCTYEGPCADTPSHYEANLLITTAKIWQTAVLAPSLQIFW